MLRIEELIKLLLDQNALLFGEFTLKSGKKSPYYVNLAKLIKTGKGFSKISATLAGYINANFLDKNLPEERRVDPDNLFLFGPAYKGIPMAGGVAYALFEMYDINVRWGFNRKEAKLHGDSDDLYLMGEMREDDSVIILDDVLTTGMTKLAARDDLIKFTGFKNLNFIAVVALIDRFEGGLPLRQQIDAFGVMRIDNLVRKCYEKEWISKEEHDAFFDYFNKHGLVENK